MKGKNRWQRWTGAVVLGLTAAAGSAEVRAQCANCGSGNTSYQDEFGGYSSGPYRSDRANNLGGGLGHRHSSGQLASGWNANSGYGAWGHRQVQPLFDNAFTQGRANQADAALYVSPVGVPGWVGHTYVTYQPFYPEEYLYTHKDRYHSYYDQGFGLNRTKATYWAPPVHTAVKQFYHKIQLPRQ